MNVKKVLAVVPLAAAIALAGCAPVATPETAPAPPVAEAPEGQTKKPDSEATPKQEQKPSPAPSKPGTVPTPTPAPKPQEPGGNQPKPDDPKPDVIVNSGVRSTRPTSHTPSIQAPKPNREPNHHENKPSPTPGASQTVPAPLNPTPPAPPKPDTTPAPKPQEPGSNQPKPDAPKPPPATTPTPNPDTPKPDTPTPKPGDNWAIVLPADVVANEVNARKAVEAATERLTEAQASATVAGENLTKARSAHASAVSAKEQAEAELSRLQRALGNKRDTVNAAKERAAEARRAEAQAKSALAEARRDFDRAKSEAGRKNVWGSMGKEAYINMVSELVAEKTNMYRKSYGLQEVAFAPSLVPGAKEWSKTMYETGDFKHQSGNYAENILQGHLRPSLTPEEAADYIFRAWKESPGHDSGMRWEDANLIAISFHMEDGSSLMYSTMRLFAADPNGSEAQGSYYVHYTNVDISKNTANTGPRPSPGHDWQGYEHQHVNAPVVEKQVPEIGGNLAPEVEAQHVERINRLEEDALSKSDAVLKIEDEISRGEGEMLKLGIDVDNAGADLATKAVEESNAESEVFEAEQEKRDAENILSGVEAELSAAREAHEEAKRAVEKAKEDAENGSATDPGDGLGNANDNGVDKPGSGDGPGEGDCIMNC